MVTSAIFLICFAVYLIIGEGAFHWHELILGAAFGMSITRIAEHFIGERIDK